MDDVDAARPHDLAQRGPDAAIEGAPLDHFRVVDAVLAGAVADGEGAVARVADVADGDLDARIGALGAEQDRLLRSAARAAGAPQLLHTHSSVHRAVTSAWMRVAAAGTPRSRQSPTSRSAARPAAAPLRRAPRPHRDP